MLNFIKCLSLKLEVLSLSNNLILREDPSGQLSIINWLKLSSPILSRVKTSSTLSSSPFALGFKIKILSTET